MRYRTVAVLFIVLWLGLLLLTSCDRGPRLPPLERDATLLAFGDSLTFGTGAGSDASYPAVLQELIGRAVINAGIPGEISAEGRARLPELLDRYQPRLLLLCHGANDILRGMDQAQAAANLRAMIGMARERDIGVLLIAVPRFGFILNAAPWYRETAEAMNVPLEEGIMSRVIRDSRLKSDQIHPNAEGYRLIAEAVTARLRDAGAI